MSLVIRRRSSRVSGPVERELLGDRVEDALGEVVRGLLLEELRAEFRDHGVVDAASGRHSVPRPGISRGDGDNGAGKRGRTLGG